MPPPPTSDQAQRGREIKQLLVQKFYKIGDMSNFYINVDLDDISEKTITKDIRYLEKIHSDFNRSERKLPIDARVLFNKIAVNIEGQVAQIIPHLYSARYAKKNNDMGGFYSSMQQSRSYWKNILGLLQRELG